jgi:hypothetical protein
MEVCARNIGAEQSGLTEGDEDFVSGLIFPAIARRYADIAADVVVLQLEGELHIGNEIHDRVDCEHVHTDMPGRQGDERRVIQRDERKIRVRPVCDLQAGMTCIVVIEAAADQLEINRYGPPIETSQSPIEIVPMIPAAADGYATRQRKSRWRVFEIVQA